MMQSAGRDHMPAADRSASLIVHKCPRLISGNHCYPVASVVLGVARRSDVREEPREQQPWLYRALEIQAIAVDELLQQVGARMSRSGNVPPPRCSGQEGRATLSRPSTYCAHLTGSDTIPVAQRDALADA